MRRGNNETFVRVNLKRFINTVNEIILNVTAFGKTVSEARRHAYAAVDLIDWPQGFCRRDIGWRAIAREAD